MVHSRSSKASWRSAQGLVLKCKAGKSSGWPASPLQTEDSGGRYTPSNLCIKPSADCLCSAFTSKKLGKAESVCSKPSRWPLDCPIPVYKWKQKHTSFRVNRDWTMHYPIFHHQTRLHMEVKTYKWESLLHCAHQISSFSKEQNANDKHEVRSDKVNSEVMLCMYVKIKIPSPNLPLKPSINCAVTADSLFPQSPILQQLCIVTDQATVIQWIEPYPPPPQTHIGDLNAWKLFTRPPPPNEILKQNQWTLHKTPIPYIPCNSETNLSTHKIQKREDGWPGVWCTWKETFMWLSNQKLVLHYPCEWCEIRKCTSGSALNFQLHTENQLRILDAYGVEHEYAPLKACTSHTHIQTDHTDRYYLFHLIWYQNQNQPSFNKSWIKTNNWKQWNHTRHIQPFSSFPIA